MFTCGSNLYGQLGRETRDGMSSLPGAVPELMGSSVAQIACGKYVSMCCMLFLNVLLVGAITCAIISWNKKQCCIMGLISHTLPFLFE